jgi:hypothetical protein
MLVISYKSEESYFMMGKNAVFPDIMDMDAGV